VISPQAHNPNPTTRYPHKIVHIPIHTHTHDRRLEVICLGDFNDFDAEVLDVNDNRPTSRVLEILKGVCVHICW
jgi:hypothetical protein